MVVRVIPNYSLYGVQAQPGWTSLFDFEWIPQRSRPYNWTIRPHKHDALIQIVFIMSGSAEVLLEHSKVSVTAPCLIWIPAQSVHGFNFSSDIDGPAVTAAQRPLESLLGVSSPELIALIRKPAVIPLLVGSAQADALMPLFLAIEREAQLQSAGHITAGLPLLAAVCVHRARLSSAEQTAPIRVNDSPRKNIQIEKFRSLVEAHFKHHLPLADYANQLGITPGQLSRLCREVLGMSSLEVINARLIHEAQRELVYTGNTVKQLAYFLGFADETYFGRFFRKHTGLSPRAFRAKAMATLRTPEVTREAPTA